MTAESESDSANDECDNGGVGRSAEIDVELSRIYKALEAELTPTPPELEAARLDNGHLEGHYEADEGEVVCYEGLHFLPEREEWVAPLFSYPPGENC